MNKVNYWFLKNEKKCLEENRFILNIIYMMYPWGLYKIHWLDHEDHRV